MDRGYESAALPLICTPLYPRRAVGNRRTGIARGGGAAKFDVGIPPNVKGGALGIRGHPPMEERSADWAYIAPRSDKLISGHLPYAKTPRPPPAAFRHLATR